MQTCKQYMEEKGCSNETVWQGLYIQRSVAVWLNTGDVEKWWKTKQVAVKLIAKHKKPKIKSSP